LLDWRADSTDADTRAVDRSLEEDRGSPHQVYATRGGGIDRYDYESLSSKSFDRYLSHMYDISAQWSRRRSRLSARYYKSSKVLHTDDTLFSKEDIHQDIQRIKNLFFSNYTYKKKPHL